MTLTATFLSFVAAAAAPSAADVSKSLDRLHDFGACIVRSAPGDVSALLTIDHRTPPYGPRLTGIINGPAKGCQKKAKDITVGTGLLAGVLAESALKARFQPDIPTDMLAPNQKRQQIVARSDVEIMALCTVFAAPAASSKLLATAPGSAAESKALDTLKPTIAGCLKKGANLNAGAPMMRAVLALAAWRIVYAPKKAGQ